MSDSSAYILSLKDDQLFLEISTNVRENKKERECSSISNPFDREVLQSFTTELGVSLQITY